MRHHSILDLGRGHSWTQLSLADNLNQMIAPIAMLFLSNVFMTFAWYGHLKGFKTSPLWMVIVISWGIAFFEYSLQVPANRWGSEHYSLAQLKIIQEVLTMVVFSGFAIFYMKESLRLDYLWAALCLVGAVYFIFRSPS